MSLDTRPDLSEPDLPDAEADPGRDVSVGDLFGRVYALFHNKRFGLALILALGFLTLLGVLHTRAARRGRPCCRTSIPTPAAPAAGCCRARRHKARGPR